MNISEIRELQAEFEKIRLSFRKDFNELKKLIKKFEEDYSVQNIENLTLDEYIVGKGDPTFCNRIDFINQTIGFHLFVLRDYIFNGSSNSSNTFLRWNHP